MKLIAFETIANDVRAQVLTSLCEHSEEGIFILDSDFRIQWVNVSYENIVGHTLSDLQGHTLSVYALTKACTHPQLVTAKIEMALIKKKLFQGNVLYITSYNTQFKTNLTIWGVEHFNERYYVGLLRDIHHAKETGLAHKQAISYNPITSLPNRYHFVTQLNNLIENTQRSLTIVILSIDKFRMISNTLSEVDKNTLLIQIISRLKALPLQHLKIFSHFDDHDFVLVFETADKDMVYHELNKITEKCKSPFSVAEHKFYLNFSMGISVFPDHGQHFDSLSRSAEIALHTVKTSGGNGICWYDEIMNQKTLEQLKLETELHNAFKRHQFIPHYQPKTELKTGRFTGFEALVRWKHPTQGLLSAGQFMQTIIDNHLTYNLFKQMAKSAVIQLDKWLKQGFNCSVCLNVDASEFRHPNFVNYLEHLIAKYPNCRSYLHIEITETSLLINDKVATDILNQLRRLGITITLDDFGTGYSSLSYLQNYEFDCVKIDRSFVEDVHCAPKNLAIVQAIISLAHSMGMEVIAEGVESIEQFDKLKDIDCDYGQGYYIGKPMSPIQATQLLAGCSSPSSIVTSL